MKQYGCFQAIFMSFYSGNLYRDVARNWGAGTFLYLLLLLTLCWAILMVPVQRNVSQGFSEVMTNTMADWPKNISVKDGIVSTPENRPYLIKDNKTNETLIVIDTSGQYTQLQDTQAGMLVTKDSLIYWNDAPQPEKVQAVVEQKGQNTSITVTNQDSGKITIQKIPSHVNFDMDSVKVKEILLKVTDWLWILMLPFLIIFSFLYRILQSLFYALIGKLFAVLTGIAIIYTDIVKLAMVAVTPAIVISTILEWFGKWSHYSSLFFMLSIAYVIFAVHANRQK